MLKTVASLFVLYALLAPLARAAGYGFDAGQEPGRYSRNIEDAEITGKNGTWLRVRGMAGGGGEGDHAGRTRDADRQAILALHQRGVRVCVILRWGPQEWSRGVRVGGGHRLPLDLREAYERGRLLGATYGDVVDVWEIENESDIGFVADNPETYAAFLKAAYLGLHAGAQASAAGLSDKVKFKEQSVQSTWRTQKRGWSDVPFNLSSSSGVGAGRAKLRVIMAPLALPPGPYLERLWANGIASYTDGFNFHYYGYAEDFTGVYRQFENAISTLSAETAENHTSSSSVNSGTSVLKKRFPVFITEYGYGLLDAEARNTVKGRVRQWRWFASVANQLRTLRPEGPMAFVLNPYYENGLNEFGLTMAAQPELRGSLSPKIKVKEDGGRTEPRGGDGHVQSTRPRSGSDGVSETGHLLGGRVNNTENRGRSADLAVTGQSSAASANSGLKFSPDDFGAKRAQPWMAGIGKKIGDAYASPALAYLWDYAERHPYRSLDWSVEAEPPSPVVIDFIAGMDMSQIKVSGGYRLQGVSPEWTPHALRQGDAKLVLYNFGADSVTGELAITAPNPVISTYDKRVTLAPGERREIPLRLSIDGAEWKAHALKATFIAVGQVTPGSLRSGRAGAVFTTALYPAIYGLTAVPIETFSFKNNVEARAQVAARPLASEEPRLQDQGGRWLATDGVRVEEKDGLWRIHIDHLADTPLRPAAVELPLPRGFVFPADTVFSYQYRIRPDGGQRKDGAAKHQPLAGVHGDGMTVYIRTANGNLYFAGSRLSLTPEWRAYAGRSQDFTMGFFGRAALPWRFADNTPVSLFIYLRPSQLPTVFEIRDARISKFKTED